MKTLSIILLGTVLAVSNPSLADNTAAVSPELIAKADAKAAQLKKRIEGGKTRKLLSPEVASRLETKHAALTMKINAAKADGKVTEAEMQAIREDSRNLENVIRKEKQAGDLARKQVRT